MIDREAVTALLRQACERFIVPRLGRLGAKEIIEKAPGELVTAVDHEVEQFLADSLLPLLPGSGLVGEEGCATDPGLLDAVEQGLVWLLDPLDGTANFAAGKPPFAVMLALLQNGEPLASWMLDPLSGVAWTAAHGGGAWRDGIRVRVDPGFPESGVIRGALISHFMPPGIALRVRARLPDVELLEKLMCSGAEYPAIALGDRNVSLFWRTLPWDHVPGALFLCEAGGLVCRLDGSPYRAASQGEGLIVAQNPAIAEKIIEALAD